MDAQLKQSKQSTAEQIKNVSQTRFRKILIGKAMKLSEITNSSSQNMIPVLLVEDNPVNQKLAQKILIKLGYDVDVACNGEIAVEKVKQSAYSIIVMDIQMPIMDGIEATRQIRSLDINQPFIVALTANVSEENRKSCIDAGMNDFLGKPLRKQLLKESLQSGVDSAE